jgi:glycosyltransferase involved in cell wall biosynthesis
MRKKLIARYGGSWVRNNRNTFVNDVIRVMMRIFAGGKNVMLVSGIGNKPPGKKIHWLFSTAVSRSEIEKYKPNFNRGLSVPAQLVFIGRLSPEKGVDILIQAFRLIKDRNFQPMPNLVILGDGPESERLQKLSLIFGLDQSIQFTGMVNRDALVDYLLKADLCVQATLTEGLSKAWLDAFAFGLPVIVGNVGAAAAAVGENNKRGWMVKTGDPVVLADCIQKILTSKINWPVIRQQCRQYAESKTLEDWSNQIGQICADQWQMQLVEGKLIS